MFKIFTTILVAVLGLVSLSVIAAPAAGSDIQTFLNAPVWYIEYEVSFKASFDDGFTGVGGPMTRKISLDLSFSARKTLDARSQGPSPFLDTLSGGGSADGENLSTAEIMQHLQAMQQNAQAMLARMEGTASWITGLGLIGLDENATDEELAAGVKANKEASMGLAKIDYSRVDAGTNLFDPGYNTTYNRTSQVTRKGSGKVYPGAEGIIILEVDASAKKYALLLPFSFDDLGSTSKVEKIANFQYKGEQPVEHRDSSEEGLESFPDEIILDDPKNLHDEMTKMAVVHGDIDPSAGKISGERALSAHYFEDRFDDSKASVPGTLVFRYTLTMTPPPKPAAPGK